MVAVGYGARTRIAEQIQNLGTNMIIVTPGSSAQGGVSQGAQTFNRLRIEDAEALVRETTLLSSVSPVVMTRTQVIGGEGNYQDPRGLSVDNEAYDSRTDTWHKLPPMPTPTHGLVGAAFVNGRIHIPGGSVTIGGGTGSVVHQVYRPTMSCES